MTSVTSQNSAWDACSRHCIWCRAGGHGAACVSSTRPRMSVCLSSLNPGTGELCPPGRGPCISDGSAVGGGRLPGQEGGVFTWTGACGPAPGHTCILPGDVRRVTVLPELPRAPLLSPAQTWLFAHRRGSLVRRVDRAGVEESPPQRAQWAAPVCTGVWGRRPCGKNPRPFHTTVSSGCPGPERGSLSQLSVLRRIFPFLKKFLRFWHTRKENILNGCL